MLNLSLVPIASCKLLQKFDHLLVLLADAGLSFADVAADLVFHLLVLLADAGLSFADVAADLARREGLSGHEEKAQR